MSDNASVGKGVCYVADLSEDVYKVLGEQFGNT